MSTSVQTRILAGLSMRRGRFVRSGLYAVLLAVFLSALPAQIRWADGTGRFDEIGEAGTKFRLLTVSRTMLYGGRAGWDAVLHEALWAALFVGVLVGGARAMAIRTAKPPVRPLFFCMALVILAPLANLMALYVLGLPDLVSKAVLRDEILTELLWEAQSGSAHAMLLGACGSVAAYVA